MLPDSDMNRMSDNKFLINIGGGFDIPTGTWVKGKYGENILNGGVGPIMTVQGGPNSFKSAVVQFMMLSAMNRVSYAMNSKALTLDSEINSNTTRLIEISQRYDNFKDKNIIRDKIWIPADASTHFLDEFIKEMKDWLKLKKGAAKNITLELPIKQMEEELSMKDVLVTFSYIDSLTEACTKNTADKLEGLVVGDSQRNTVPMRDGLEKHSFLKELPRLVEEYKHYVFLTAQLGKMGPQIGGNPNIPPPKEMQHMRQNEKVKGVTEKLLYLSFVTWQIMSAKPFNNQTTKAPEFPRNIMDNQTPSFDLNHLDVKTIRSKCGPSGANIGVLASQSEGLLPTLSEFAYVKDKAFGVGGNKLSYHMELLPDVGLSRTTVRSKIDTIPELRRAINITSELRQMYEYHWKYSNLLCSPLELKRDLEKMGYDWNVLLKTRGWATYNNDKHDIQFLSTLDLLEMRAGIYKPYWM